MTTLEVSFPPSTKQRPPIDMIPDVPSVLSTGSSEEQSMIPESNSITHTPEFSDDPGDNQAFASQMGSGTTSVEYTQQDDQESGNILVERGSRPTLEVAVDWIGESLDESMRNSIEEIVKREAKRYNDDEYPGSGDDFSALLERIGSALSAALGWTVDKLDSTKEYWNSNLLVGFLVVRGVATLIWVGLRLISADRRPGLEYLAHALDVGGYYLGQIPRPRLMSINIGAMPRSFRMAWALWLRTEGQRDLRIRVMAWSSNTCCQPTLARTEHNAIERE